ncbi:MAG: peroxiredoxin-like family protein [Parvularculaceae bacterium]
MSQSSELLAKLDAVTLRAKSLTDLPLAERLKLIADEVRNVSTLFADEVERFVGKLHEAEAGGAAPRIGDEMPDFLLPDQNGKLIGLEQLRKSGPVVVAFLRGHWCPYCTTTAKALGEIASLARAKGASIVAISPESRKYSNRLTVDTAGAFPVLTDVDNGYALALNLAIWVDDEMAALIQGAGWDVPSYQTAKSWVLPIPATFVVGADGRVAARYVNPDYRTRMEIDDIMRGLDAAR